MTKAINQKITYGYLKLKNLFADKKGEGYVDSGVKILIAIVIGGLLLSGLTLLFKNVILPTVNSRINSMFATVSASSMSTPST